MAVLNNSNAISPSGYNLTNSLRFRSSATAYLSRTPASAGNRQTWTISFWWKRGSISSEQYIVSADTSAANETWLRINAADTLQFQTLGGTNANLTTSSVFRDPSAWYHIVMAYDSTQATAGNRFKLYVNGNQQTLTGTNPTLNESQAINNTVSQQFCRRASTSGSYADNYLTDVYLIDGQALTPSSFGSTNATTGVWQPARYTGTYGTNGFYLNFSDIAQTVSSNVGLGKDNSGNTNYWVTNNISTTAGTTYDAMTDVPTLTSATVANYAVMNPLDKGSGTISNGNLQCALAGDSGARATMAIPSSGKWYWELTDVNQADRGSAGIATIAKSILAFPTNLADSIIYLFWAGLLRDDGTDIATYSTLTTNDIAMFAVDADSGKFWVGKNGTWFNSGVPASGTGNVATLNSGVTYAPFFLEFSASSTTVAYNFGQRPFAYTPPTGFVRLNTFNLPDSTIVKGNTVMDATLYTGTGASLSVTNASAFKPDLVWVKSRSNATDNELTDSVRGVTKSLVSNSTAAEATDTNGLTAFNSNGFTLGTDANYNGSARTFVGWQWQAGQGSTSSNTSGSITSTVSVNATAGFSILTFNAGANGNKTVGHGLGVKPAMFVFKDRSTGNWLVWHQSLSSQTQSYLLLSSTAASANDSRLWANTAPTPTLLSFETGYTFNTSASCLAYCWAEIAGFSKFGSYTGNASTDGPFIYLGFRPKFVLIKRTDSTSNWYLFDTARDTYNVMKNELLPNSTNAEADNTRWIDTLSNGFKIRNDNASQINASGATMVYMAFAENPFKNANAR
jgi:hypothetical protein